jgi:hypothetical protein
MPNYDAARFTTALYSAQSELFFDAEQPAAPQASRQFHIPQGRLGSAPPSLTIEGFFSGDPGVFDIAIQEADTNTDDAYQTIPSAGNITAVDGNFYFRVDLAPFVGVFIRLNLVTRTNGVNLTAKATRR